MVVKTLESEFMFVSFFSCRLRIPCVVYYKSRLTNCPCWFIFHISTGCYWNRISSWIPVDILYFPLFFASLFRIKPQIRFLKKTKYFRRRGKTSKWGPTHLLSDGQQRRSCQKRTIPKPKQTPSTKTSNKIFVTKMIGHEPNHGFSPSFHINLINYCQHPIAHSRWVFWSLG